MRKLWSWLHQKRGSICAPNTLVLNLPICGQIQNLFHLLFHLTFGSVYWIFWAKLNWKAGQCASFREAALEGGRVLHEKWNCFLQIDAVFKRARAKIIFLTSLAIFVNGFQHKRKQRLREIWPRSFSTANIARQESSRDSSHILYKKVKSLQKMWLTVFLTLVKKSKQASVWPFVTLYDNLISRFAEGESNA